MRKPKLEIDLKPIVEKALSEAIIKRQTEVLKYAIIKKNLEKGFNTKNLKQSAEYIQGKTSPVLTIRYNGIFLYREITIDKEGLHFKFLLDENEGWTD